MTIANLRSARQLLACAVLAGGLAACQSDSQSDRAVTGGLIGAGAGAVVGAATTGRAGGALAGAAIGGAGGALLGAATTPERRGWRRGEWQGGGWQGGGWCDGYDSYGEPVSYRC
jgi:osmotically inducible lipoprotein OsmB